MDRPPSPRPTPMQVLLGLFIVWQIFFLVASNYAGALLLAPPEISYELADDLPGSETYGLETPNRKTVLFFAVPLHRWGELTGQWQGWSLFAPEVPHLSAFAAVRLQWDKTAGGMPREVTLLSPFEPENPLRFWRPPERACRLFNYEWRLVMTAWFWDERLMEGLDAERIRWEKQGMHDLMADRFRRQWPCLRAYLQQRAGQFRKQHPDWPAPDRVVLLARVYQPPLPGHRPWHWEGPVERPLARWVDHDADNLPIELYDMVTDQFEPLRAAQRAGNE